MSLVALSEMLGASVRDASGAVRGRVREIAVTPQEHPTRVAFLIVKTPEGERMLPLADVKSAGARVRANSDAAAWERYAPSDGVLLLKRDLLDQQIIDVYGRKVVRVNDVEIESTPVNSDRGAGAPGASNVSLNVVAVDVGARGAIRRLSKGVVPSFTLRALLEKIPHRVIPWQFVNIIETDPARRVKLNIAYEGLEKLHPADIADIVEDLPPADREAVFETIDEEVAAETLEELEPDIMVAIVESLDKDRAADIVEEMDPDAAADLLAELPAAESGEILKEMEPAERQEVSQLLEIHTRTAGGRMTTEFIAVAETATVDDAIEALKTFEGSREALATIYLLSRVQTLVGSVPLVKIATSPFTTKLSKLSEDPVFCAPDTPQDEVAALFDKYNLITLAVVDEHGRLAGIITADDVITMLRHRS
jgi:flagellar motility protein MotE (MotC chaperone)/sporulation protein YlmC with PRC-barrel domain